MREIIASNKVFFNPTLYLTTRRFWEQQDDSDQWLAMSEAECTSRLAGDNDLFPSWIAS